MPPAVDQDSQVDFLVSCIQHGVNGKIDFEAVRQDCGIVSKGAAAKRYERILKTRGVNARVKTEGSAATPPNGAKGAKATKAAAKGNKKRKLKDISSDSNDDDEPVKEEPVKGEFKNEDAITVKSEHILDRLPLLPAIMTSSPTQHALVAPSLIDGGQNTPATDTDDDVLFISQARKPSTTANTLQNLHNDHFHTHSQSNLSSITHNKTSASTTNTISLQPRSRMVTPGMSLMARPEPSMPPSLPHNNWVFSYDEHPLK
ncbi:hypothetical protein F5Y16DRAFT_400955 [Xylariaceae sp. FL0255]|nr:hypothetical protein F5Y16DRAFT_400955 [Xylariaceae sp. FL0255]